jgi:hypothetical protein
MTTIAIFPEPLGAQPVGYRAVAGNRQSVGRTAGEALDALTAQLDEAERGTLVVVQHRRPDQFFTAEQQQRLQELMARWRAARDALTRLPETSRRNSRPSSRLNCARPPLALRPWRTGNGLHPRAHRDGARDGRATAVE